MTIDVAISAAIQPEQTTEKLVVVIDVLRATSVICTGLYHGAKAFIPVETVDEAQNIKSDDKLLAGERKGFKIDGFDLGNSPLEYTADIVKDKTIILTTTNGTRAIKNSTHPHELIIGSFLNLNTICEYIQQQERDVCLVCAGTVNKFSLDDALCAGNIISVLTTIDVTIQLTDVAFAHKTLYESVANKDLHTVLKEGCKHYSYLKQNGFSADLDYCLRRNACPVLPKLIGDKIQL